jgi:ribonuclease E
MKENTAAVHVQVPVEVTSFLLNEKRTEITKIELKQRVTVLLVPNKNLETPNYRLERLRHDDPRLENLQASYTMIDDVEEEVGITRREKAKAKQEPVIKGILPDAPAPQPEPKPEPVAAAPVAAPAPAPVAAPAVAGSGFFGWVKRLFGGGEASAPAAAPAAPAKAAAAEPRKEGRGERGERGGRGGRDGRRGEQRGEGRNAREGREGREGRDGGRDGRGRRGEPRNDQPRAERPEGEEATTPRSESGNESRGEGRRGGRGERGERGERADRGERRPAPEAVVADAAAQPQPFVDTVPTGDAAAEGERSGRRRRRGRGGRDRDEARTVEGTNELNVGEAVATDGEFGADVGTLEPTAEAIGEGAPAAAEGEEREGGRRRRGRDRQRRERREEGATAAGESGLVEDVSAPAAPAATPVEAEPIAVAAVAPAPLVVVAEPAPTSVAAHIEPFVLPADQLTSIAEAAGLQWVNSDADKIRAVQEAMAREPKPVHVPRERKPLVVVDEGPLVLVETRKDLSQITLPFDTAR